MVRPGSDRLSGSVDVDEAYWGSEEEGVIGRQVEAKALIAVAVESTGGKIGRIRMRRIPDASSKSLHGFITEMIEPNSVIYGCSSVGCSERIKVPLGVRIWITTLMSLRSIQSAEKSMKTAFSSERKRENKNQYVALLASSGYPDCPF